LAGVRAYRRDVAAHQFASVSFSSSLRCAILKAVGSGGSAKNIILFRIGFHAYSRRFRWCGSTPGRGLDERFRDSHDGPEKMMDGSESCRVEKSYTRAQWDEFVDALEGLPEKPRHDQRVTVSDAMKEIRAHITATQAKGYTLEEIVQEAGRKGLDVSIGAVKYALYRPAPSDAASRSDPIRRQRARPLRRPARSRPLRQKARARGRRPWRSHDNKGEGASTSRDRWRFRTRSRLRSDLISKTCRRLVVDTIHPIYLVGGSKGGVGKSMVTLALADYLQRQGTHAVLLETDTSNPDVMKALRDEIKCAAYDLDDADGWIGFVNFCDAHRGAAVIVNTAARNQTGVDTVRRDARPDAG
jgi:hypothetical protein